MIIDRKTFFDAIRKPLFPKGMSQKVVDGIEFILTTWERQYQDRMPITQFANALGTVYHETAATMQPIHEYGDRAYFMRMYDKTGSRPGVAATLGNTVDGDGAKFAGMGFVQLTGRANYRKATQRLRELGLIAPDVDFERDPNLVMQGQYAIPILFIGMSEGWFTGKKLSDLVDADLDGDEHSDFVKARAIINGKDRAEDIANYSNTFLSALKIAKRDGAPAITEVVKPPAPTQAPAPQSTPTAANPEPKGWFEHMLDVLRSHRKPA